MVWLLKKNNNNVIFKILKDMGHIQIHMGQDQSHIYLKPMGQNKSIGTKLSQGSDVFGRITFITAKNYS